VARTPTAPRAAPGSQTAAPGEGYPENPVLVRLWRGAHVESQHRGAWVLADASGAVLDGAGAAGASFYARSAVKALQALPLVESGAAQRFGFGDRELALALASHDAEPQHLEVVEGMLRRIGLGPGDLGCGVQPPRDAATRAALEERGASPSALHNNCSGKHAGFLALARHLGEDPARYLEPESEVQRLARRAVCAMCGVEERDVALATDGCSAPTFRLPLCGLATAFARLANPAGLAPERRAACEWMLRAATENPELIAGRRGRICTDLARAGAGRIFPKVGAEAVYALGVAGEGRALAVKIDDGGPRALHALVVRLVERFGFLGGPALESLAGWRGHPLRNWVGREVGDTEVLA
jgi:L-asparaginase II